MELGQRATLSLCECAITFYHRELSGRLEMSEVWSAVSSPADFVYKDAWTLSMFSIMTQAFAGAEATPSFNLAPRAPTKLRANSAAIKRLIWVLA